MERIEFQRDLASQRLWFRPQEGRPSATPSVEIKDNGGAVLTADATTYVTQHATDTTIASAAKGAESVTVAAATGIVVGEWYRMVNALSQVEWVRVISLTGTTVGLGSPLQYDFTSLISGSSYGEFESTAFYYTLQSSDYDEIRALARGIATYAVGGITYTMRLEFDVCAVPLWNPLTAAAMYAAYPDIARQEPVEQRGSDFERQRDEAWRRVKHRFRQETTSRGMLRPAMAFDLAALYQWALCELTLVLHEIGVEARREEGLTLEMLRQERDDERARSLTSVFLDVDQDEAGEEPELRPELYR